MRTLFKLLFSTVLLFSMFALMIPSPVYASPAYESQAFVAYRSGTDAATNSVPKNRIWGGTAWGAENAMATAGSPVRWVRVAYCPNGTRYYEKIVVTLSDDGNLDAYVWTGAAWSVTNDIAVVGTTANAYRAFDIAYESTTGRALLVYSRGVTTDGQELGYKIWNGASWSAESYVTGLPTAVGVVFWVALASKPTNGANDIAMIFSDNGPVVHGMVWTGTAWSDMGHGTAAVWDSTVAIATKEIIAVAYEQLSGDALFIWADSVTTDFYYRTWDGTTLSANTLLDISDAAQVGNWVVLKSRPGYDGILFGEVDAGLDLNTRYWSGTAWDSATEHPEHDASTDPVATRIFDLDWAPDGSHALLAYGDGSAGDSLNWRKGTPTTGATWWTGATEVAAGDDVAWVILKSNPRVAAGDIKILGVVVQTTANNVGSLKWDGTTLTPARTAFASGTGLAVPYESVDLEFQNYLPASLFVWPATQSVTKGFYVYVNITAPDPLYAWELKLYYNTTILTAINVTLGPFLNNSAGPLGTTGIKSINDNYNSTHGQVNASQTMRGDTPGATGTGTSLVRIGFSIQYGPATSFLRPRETILVGYRFDKKVVFTIPHTVTDGTATVTISIPEFPLGFILEIALAGVLIYFWWKHKSTTKTNIPTLSK